MLKLDKWMYRNLYKSFGYKAIEVVVIVLYAFFLIPILLYFWEIEVYGAWIAIYAFFNLIQVIEQGHGRFVGNAFNRIVHTNKEKAKRILGSGLRFNIFVGFFEMAIVGVCYATGLLRYVLDDGIDDTTVALVLSILFLYRICIGSYRGIIVKILNPFGLIYKSFQFALTEKILDFFILVVAATTQISLVELAILWFFVKTAYSLIILIELKKLLPEYFPWWKYGNFRIGAANFKKSIYFSASNFLDRFSNDGVLLIISAFVGTSFLPLFSATRTLVNFGYKLSDFFLNPLEPEMINLYAKKKKQTIIKVFKSYWFFSALVLILPFSLSLLFIEDFFRIWTHGALEFNLLLYSALVVIFLIKNYGKVMDVFFTGINKTKIVLLSSLIRLFFLFAVLLTSGLENINAILLALLISESVVVILWFPYHCFRIFSLQISEKISFFPNLLMIVFFAILLYFNFIHKSIWYLLCLFAPILYLIYYQYGSLNKKLVIVIVNSIRNLLKIKKG